MTITAKQIADWTHGRIIGDENTSVNNISKIEEGNKECISFVAHQKYVEYLKDSQAGIILISENLVPDFPVNSTLIVVPDANESFVTLLNLYNQLTTQKTGIDPHASIHTTSTIGEKGYVGAFAVIDENVTIGDNCKIYPNVYVGNNVKIGNNVTLEPNVVIFNDCELKDNIIIHSGTVIGSDGFGFLPKPEGYEKIPQLGNVIIESNVEIGSNCTIDRATMGSTIIKAGAKLDNLIQIAHNVEVGSHTVIASQAGIAGSTKIGQWNMIGGQVGIVGHLKIGNFVKIQAQSGVNKNVKDESSLYGSPAFDANDYRKSYVYFKNLKSLSDKIDKLENEILNLSKHKKDG